MEILKWLLAPLWIALAIVLAPILIVDYVYSAWRTRRLQRATNDQLGSLALWKRK